MRDILKGKNDCREYRFCEFGNGLKVVLIDSTKEVEGGEGEPAFQAHLHSSAALCIGVGSFNEPEEVQGLAHLTEHILFMGSQKYPGEDTFDRFICKHQGMSNAETLCEHMVFYLEIEAPWFDEALDMFAHIFADAEVKQRNVEHEIEVVDREFRLTAANLGTKRELIFSTMASPGHPMGRFSWGNAISLKTLPREKGIDVRTKVLEFIAEHFSADNMYLAIESATPLNDLEFYARKTFEIIPKRKILKKTFSEVPPFVSDDFYKLYCVASVTKTNQLSITWSMPSVKRHFKTKPLQVLGWILGYEGEHGLLDYFRDKIWAITLTAGNNDTSFEQNSTNSLFSVTIVLTEKGMYHVFDIVTTILEYIELMRSEIPVIRRIFAEIKTIQESNFIYQADLTRKSVFVEKVATNLLHYGPNFCVVGDDLYLEYDEKCIEDCLGRLTSDKINLMITSSHYKDSNISNKEEPWTRTPFSVSDIPKEWREVWKKLGTNCYPLAFKLPKPNEYIARDFTLKVPDLPYSRFPIKLVENSQSRLWYKKDEVFKKPMVYIYYHLVSSLTRASVESATLTDLAINLLHYSLYKVLHDAQVAGVCCNVASTSSGIVIKISGFNHKIFDVFRMFLEILENLDVQDYCLENLKCQLSKNYYNAILSPLTLAQDLRLSILECLHWSPLEKLHLVEGLDKEILLNFWRKFRSCLFIEGLIQGNITGKEALDIHQYFLENFKFFPLPSVMIPERRTTLLSHGVYCCRVASLNPEDVNTVVAEYYQCGIKENESMLELAVAPLKHLLFEQLRTREQLTYDVCCDIKSHMGVLGFWVMVTSPSDKFSCTHIAGRLASFMNSFEERLLVWNAESFERNRTSLIKMKETQEKLLRQEVARNWHEIVSFQYKFERRYKKILNLQNLRYGDFSEWLEAHIPFSKSFPKLCIQVVGNEDPLAKGKIPKGLQSLNSLDFEDFLHSPGSPTPDKESEQKDVPRILYLLPLDVNEGKIEYKEMVNYIADINYFKRSRDLFKECLHPFH